MTKTGGALVFTPIAQATCVIQDNKNAEGTKETMALLKILAVGRKQIAASQFKPVPDVFAKLDLALLSSGTYRAEPIKSVLGNMCKSV